jgi:ComF family protein
MPSFITLAGSILSLLYPQSCGTCGGSVEEYCLGVTCAGCWNSTRIFEGNETLCAKCGSFLNDSPTPHPTFCGRCDGHEYDEARAAGVYEGAVRNAVLGLKSTPYVSSRMKRELTAAFVRTGFASADLIIPVPLSKKRFVERGHNQAAVIGRVISKNLAIKMDAAALERERDTPMHRAGMDQKARDLTVKKAFKVVHPRVVNGKNIVLVDDVFTSGATASACAQVLKKNGASRVFVFTLGRAILFK